MIFSDRLANKYKDTLDEEGTNFIDRIIKSSMRMRMLITNILVYSKSYTSFDLFEITDLNVLLEGILSDLEISITQKKLYQYPFYFPKWNQERLVVLGLEMSCKLLARPSFGLPTGSTIYLFLRNCRSSSEMLFK